MGTRRVLQHPLVTQAGQAGAGEGGAHVHVLPHQVLHVHLAQEASEWVTHGWVAQVLLPQVNGGKEGIEGSHGVCGNSFSPAAPEPRLEAKCFPPAAPEPHLDPLQAEGLDRLKVCVLVCPQAALHLPHTGAEHEGLVRTGGDVIFVVGMDRHRCRCRVGEAGVGGEATLGLSGQGLQVG